MTNPPDAGVLWLPEDDTSAIVLAVAPAAYFATPESHPPIDNAFTAGDGPETIVLHALGDHQHLQLVRGGGRHESRPLAALVPLSLQGFDRLESVARLLASLHGRSIPADTRLTPQHRARLRRMLQCFDGYRHGATQKEIAQIVFRTGELDRDDWQASSARHAVKSLLRDARSMIAGGYRTLLRHRRQP